MTMQCDGQLVQSSHNSRISILETSKKVCKAEANSTIENYWPGFAKS